MKENIILNGIVPQRQKLTSLCISLFRKAHNIFILPQNLAYLVQVYIMYIHNICNESKYILLLQEYVHDGVRLTS